MDAIDEKDEPPPPIPEYPAGLTLENPQIGAVSVSVHAWERFCRRYAETQRLEAVERPQTFFIETMKRSFLDAMPDEIDPVHRVRRIIDHDFTVPHFFRNRQHRLRYVISEDRPYRLITVEIPY